MSGGWRQASCWRCTKVRDIGPARLIECTDRALAVLIANSPKTRKYCIAAGERRLVVKVSAEAAFRRGLRELGYCLASDDAQATRGSGGRTRHGGRSKQ